MIRLSTEQKKSLKGSAMNKRTRALDISPKVKKAVWERDGCQCIICGSREAMPNAHYISRARGGLGIEENIVTLCRKCHDLFDNSRFHDKYKREIKLYLKSCYRNWNENDLIYNKEFWKEENFEQHYA